MKLALVLAFVLTATAVEAQAPPWTLTAEKGQPAELVFGAYDLILRCPPGAKGQITVDLKVPASGEAAIPRSVKLSSGLASATLRGQAPVLGKLGASFAESEFSTSAPVADAFRKTGQISVSAMEVTQSPPPAKPAMARKFLNACR
ncbi:hypothetical protein BH11PSE1_BH11PSE1_29320 [soil metagenome]